jgi:hypothetical protein
MVSAEQKRRGTNLKKALSASMVTPSPKEESTGRTNGTVVQRARFEIKNVRHLQRLAGVRWRGSSIAVKEGSRILFGCPPCERGSGRIAGESSKDRQSS